MLFNLSGIIHLISLSLLLYSCGSIDTREVGKAPQWKEITINLQSNQQYQNPWVLIVGERRINHGKN